MCKCNECSKPISQEEFNNGMGVCLKCFPELDKETSEFLFEFPALTKDVLQMLSTRDEDGMPY